MLPSCLPRCASCIVSGFSSAWKTPASPCLRGVPSEGGEATPPPRRCCPRLPSPPSASECCCQLVVRGAAAGAALWTRSRGAGGGSASCSLGLACKESVAGCTVSKNEGRGGAGGSIGSDPCLAPSWPGLAVRGSGPRSDAGGGLAYWGWGGIPSWERGGVTLWFLYSGRCHKSSFSFYNERD